MNLGDVEAALDTMGAMNSWTIEAAFHRYSVAEAASEVLEREARLGTGGWVSSTSFERFDEVGSLAGVLARVIDRAHTPDARQVAAYQKRAEPRAADVRHAIDCLDAVYALWGVLRRYLGVDSAVDALREAGVPSEHVGLALCTHFGCQEERAQLPVAMRASTTVRYRETDMSRRSLAAHLGMRPWRVLRLLCAAPLWSQLPDEMLAIVATHACGTREHPLHCALAALANGQNQELAAPARAFRADARMCLALYLETYATRGREALVASRANLRRHGAQLRALERVAAPSPPRPWFAATAVPVLNTLVVCDHATYRALCTHEAVRARDLKVQMATWRCDLHAAMHADVVCVQPAFVSTLRRFVFRRIVVLGRAATSGASLCAGLRSYHRWVFAGLDLSRPKVYPMDPAQSHFLGWTLGQPGVRAATPFLGFDGVGPRLSELPKHVLRVP